MTLLERSSILYSIKWGLISNPFFALREDVINWVSKLLKFLNNCLPDLITNYNNMDWKSRIKICKPEVSKIILYTPVSLLTISVHLVEMFIVCRPNPSMESINRPIVQVDGPWSKIRPVFHLKIIILARRPHLSIRWMVWAQISVRCPQPAVFVHGGLLLKMFELQGALII